MPSEFLKTHDQNPEGTILQHEGLHDTTMSHPATDHNPNPHGESLIVDTTTQLGRGPVIAAIVVVAVLVVAVALGIHSRSKAESTLENETHAMAVPDVFVTHPSTGAAAQELRLPANTEAYIDTPIYSRTNGYLEKWFADIGTPVTKGELLAIVQTPEVDQQVQQADAEVNTAKANAELAEITNNRWKALLAKNAVSRQEADQASSDLVARQATLNSAEANYRRLQQMQGFEKIYAPFSGVLTARNVDTGSLIQAGDSNTPHSELFHVSSLDKLRLFVPVPEVNTSAVHVGDQVEVTSDAFPGQKFIGTIVRSSDTIDPATRTLNTEVDLDNPGHKLLPGQYAFVHLPLVAASGSMTLPSNTVLFRAEGLRVGIVKGDRVHLQPVQIGHDYGSTVEIIAGLDPSDAVVLNPPDSLAEGEQVKVGGSAK